MDEIEVPTDHLHETIHEKAEEESGEGEKGWFTYVALSTAIIAVFAAIASLMAGYHSNEAVIEQIKSSDQWAFYQAKGIKAEIKSLYLNNSNQTGTSVEKYKSEQAEIKREAEAAQAASRFHLDKHVWFSRSVALFQIAIAISAISVLTRKKIMWYLSMGIALSGIILFGIGTI